MLRSVVFAVAAALVGLSSAQLPTPQEPPGFTVGGGSADAGVQLETYIDLLCPASKSAYPGLDKLVKHYKPSELRVRFVLFPLPYHQHAFTAAESAFTITNALGDDKFTKWLETVYDNQERYEFALRFIAHYWNKKTKDLTSVQVTKNFHKLAKETFPDLTDEQWGKGMTGYGGTDADSDARVSWKYTCTRTMSGTPMYTLNGVPFEAADSEWSFDDWFKVIDPLVANKKKKSEEALAVERD